MHTLLRNLASKTELAACAKQSGGLANCHPTKMGYVTVDQGKDKIACLHTADGAGICWPGGNSGWNSSYQG
eukprot:CAMPEP_0174930042 /NCGR_PEP_ID=MMETSP1355-20121228/29939_1 /TAXON_ID=464990 /ORGANISM="Hemiselmis tepida, Strain CCMP443" /LENGTH=70 /DNA_ID=CAMNT_0016176305 /DNA_START=43 /DNA_END=255 /DNA_ORIENTATION=+